MTEFSYYSVNYYSIYSMLYMLTHWIWCVTRTRKWSLNERRRRGRERSVWNTTSSSDCACSCLSSGFYVCDLLINGCWAFVTSWLRRIRNIGRCLKRSWCGIDPTSSSTWLQCEINMSLVMCGTVQKKKKN